MATSRKKLDEKNMKTLRDLASLQANKYCFLCDQRGPTYVDVTIGSFVCTKCSGLLRGITPPHRVKSISMATFTPEEIDLLKSKGNEFCKKVWLGLYEGTPPSGARDEQEIKDFMVEIFERKRYYIDPAQVPKMNGYSKTNGVISQEPKKISNNNTFKSIPKPTFNNVMNNANTIQLNNKKRPEINKENDFVADFDSAEIFNAPVHTNGIQNFANFDKNPVFNGNGFTNNSMPTPNLLNQMNNTITNNSNSAEDKYAALKDLDMALKTQNTPNTVDWNSTGSNGSLYSSPTPSGSVYSSPSPQGSLFGSPSQGQFSNLFPTNNSQENGTPNPFSNGFTWGNNTPTQNGFGGTSQNQIGGTPNPFRQNFEPPKINGVGNGFFNGCMQAPQQNNGGSPWGLTSNPFQVGGSTGMNPNNPFL